MNFNPSPQQVDIFNAIRSGDHNIMVDAKAGTGKTTTIVTGMNYVPRGSALLAPSIVFLAFNKRIADTLKERCPRTATCSTFHALGRRALLDSGIIDKNFKLDSTKCRKILYNIMEHDDEDFRSTLRLISLLKAQVHEVDYGDIDPRDLLEFHGIDFIQPERAIHSALRVLKTSDEQLGTIDFDDMLHLAVKFNAFFEPREWIFVDESQDLNSIQHEIVTRLCHHGGHHTGRMSGGPQIVDEPISPTRVVAVGDPCQAIYGFRGAHADSMEVLAKRFSMRTYPLTVSYRCPKSVVREAQSYLK
jgi:ATP-dependent DNA helicase UvrD/PcrA